MARSLSIVIPVYNGSQFIDALVERLLEVLSDERLEIVLVNDCSPDDSDRICRALHERHPDVVAYFELARNFGEHNAVMAGLNQATGEHVVIMDDDFQNPPEEVPALVEAARRGSYDVVYTEYTRKAHSAVRNLGSRLHNWMANFMLGKPKDLYLSSFKCLSRFAVDEITRYRGPFPYIDGLVLRATRRLGKVSARHEPRREGSSGYTARKLIRLWLNMFLNFSVIPLRVVSSLGVAMLGVGILLAAAVAVEKFVNPGTPVGWSSLAVIVITFSGVQLLMLGLLGEYVGHLFLSVNQTPQYIVRSACPREHRDG